MHPSPDKSSVHPDHSNSSDLCSALLRTHLLSKSYTLDGAVGDTYFPLAQPVRYYPQLTSCLFKVSIETRPQNRPYLSRKRERTHIITRSATIRFVPFLVAAEALVSESYSFSDSVQCNLEPSQVVHPSVTYMPNYTAWATELGSATPDNSYSMPPQNAVQAPANETQFTNCPPARCLYPNVDGTPCLQEINCATVPSHFVAHGIENKSRKKVIHCQWSGCVKKVTRHTFPRHIREVHLRHIRGTNIHKPDSPSLGDPMNSANDPIDRGISAQMRSTNRGLEQSSLSKYPSL
ncbi:hypothetical protein BKA82DRAFT_800781 [Pisolithus tinctorius]|uniref:Uncharacterized protein n=1 Tax=Pisolithus tinctorius Marx 270 TaxID=870435 RepID=A0A0C3PT44_PISTI|nr:hypothetical protein BKA82DRAFT_800781 [Pisolithus tinctorius]KIO11849.1 hypothetical protein M404DRAFT_800781 [Pisolithus tinctorius Marx 270]